MIEFNMLMVYLITYALCTFSIARFFRNDKQISIPIYKEFAAYFIYYIMICAVYVFIRIPMVMMVLNLVGLLLLSRLYEKKIRNNVIMVVMMYVMMVASECMAMMFCKFTPHNIWEKQGIASQMPLIFQCVALALNVQVFKKFGAMKSSDYVPWRCWGGVVMIQLVLVYFMIMLSNQMQAEFLVQATLLMTVVDFIILKVKHRKASEEANA